MAGNNKTYVGRHAFVRHFGPILTKFLFFRQIFIKSSNVKFNGNPSRAALILTDRLDEANTAFLLLCECT